MERISKALDLARQQREKDGRVASPGVLHLPANEQLQAQDGPSGQISRRVVVDPQRRERERILAPGAPGASGAAYKLLRTQVLRRMDRVGASTLAILSPSSNDGKTLTAINLAIAIAAELDRTALLVDFDLRSPSVHRRLGFEPQCGVDDCLQNGRPLQDALVRLEGYERLAILPASLPVENSSELLVSPRSEAFFNELKARYSNRIMIFDLPPVLRADDALAFSRLAEAGLIVVGEGRTAREDLMRTMNLLRDMTIVGTVLNGSREPAQPLY